MRVAHVIAPAMMGGAEQVTVDLTSALAKQGIQVYLIPILSLEDVDHPFLERAPEGVALRALRVKHRQYLHERSSFQRLARDLRISVVHTHGYRADVVDGGAARGAGVATVSTAHGFTGGGVRNRIYQWLQMRSFARCDAVVAVSRPLARQLEAGGISQDRLHTIPNARLAPSQVYDPQEARSKLDLVEEGFHVGWIGRMSPEKGPDVMLSAIELVLARGTIPDLQATFIGDGRLRAELESRAKRRGLSDRIHWLGRVPEAARFLQAFDLICLSSRSEGTPIVALEAMTVGVPLIATKVGGVADLTGRDAALLIPPDDPQALANAIEAVQRDREAAMGRVATGLARVRKEASTDDWAKAHLEIYRKVLSSRSTA
jgi:glycosyltransferase involved in cell wall biosynthesis